MSRAQDVSVFSDEFRTPCCDALMTASYDEDAGESILVCKGCYAEVVYDSGGAFLGMAR